jgi:hypothetical protein
MDILENKLLNIQEFHKEALNKQSELLYKSITEVSHHSSKSARDFDFTFKALFPSDIGKEDSNFKPNCIVEFIDGKATQVLDNIADTSKLLYDRRVMGTYYFDINIQNSFPYEQYSYGEVRGFCMTHRVLVSMDKSRSSYYSCGCYTSSNNTRSLSTISDRNEEKPNTVINHTYPFQVDNYLNLYHKDSGLYLLFNKTAFPDLPFYFAKQFSQLRDEKDIYYKIFSSKRVNTLPCQLCSSVYRSVDKRPGFLTQINEFVPDDYSRVYELFNKFRKFDGYGQSEDSISITVSNDMNDLDCLDCKDRLIQELKEKLNIMILRSEKEETLVSQMAEEYKLKSIEIQNLNQELDLAKIHIEEEKSKKNLKFISDLEKIKQEKFNLYQQLVEAEKYRIMFDNSGITLESIKKENESLNLKMTKLTNINTGLIDTIKSEKERNKKLVESNDLMVNTINTFKFKEETLSNTNKSIKNELQKYQEENINLASKLSEIGNQSSNYLELALTNRITELEEIIKTSKAENKKILEENERLLESKKKIENTIKTLSFN